MYRLRSCAERVPPTWLALGLDQGPSSLLPRGTSFGRSVQPHPPFFRRGRRSDLSARGRVPPIPEVPGRVLAPNSFKRLHIQAVPSSSTLGTFASGPCRRSHVSGATLPVATPHGRVGTPPAILLGVRPRTRSLC